MSFSFFIRDGSDKGDEAGKLFPEKNGRV